MNLDKIVYEVREQLDAISDDRSIDRRYIIQALNIFRSDYLQNMLSKNPTYPTQNFVQDISIDLSIVSRSVLPSCPLNCEVIRSVNTIPKLTRVGSVGSWYSIKTVDVLHRYIEVIEPARAGFVTFEFNVGYGFVNTDYFLYMLFKDSLELTCILLSGIFDDPLEVNPDLVEYPIDNKGWVAIRPSVIAFIKKKIGEDPLNNSEPDYATDRQATNRNTKQ